MINSNHCPSLVLNADYRPLSYFPLSIWSWKDTVKAVFLDRVNIVEEYDQKVSSPSFEMYLPSIIALKDYIPHNHTPDARVPIAGHNKTGWAIGACIF